MGYSMHKTKRRKKNKSHAFIKIGTQPDIFDLSEKVVEEGKLDAPVECQARMGCGHLGKLSLVSVDMAKNLLDWKSKKGANLLMLCPACFELESNIDGPKELPATSRVPRPKQLLDEYMRLFPGFFKLCIGYANNKGHGSEFQWRNWCYLPRTTVLDAMMSYLEEDEEICQEDKDLAYIMQALATWRMSQGVYVFDEDILHELWETPIDDKLPEETLFHLPEHCVYIATPGMHLRKGATQYSHRTKTWGPFGKESKDITDDDKESITDDGVEIRGFFALLDDGSNSYSDESDNKNLGRTLMLTLDTKVKDGVESELTLLIVCLNKGTLSESCKFVASRGGKDQVTSKQIENQANVIRPFLSLLVYLGTANADIVNAQRVSTSRQKSIMKRINKGVKILPVEGVTTWNVAFKIGADLRAQRKVYDNLYENDKTGSKKRPHVRRAHFHHVWVGEHGTDERELIVKWFPTSYINTNIDALIPTIRLVGGG